MSVDLTAEAVQVLRGLLAEIEQAQKVAEKISTVEAFADLLRSEAAIRARRVIQKSEALS
jgi:uncharacterized protein Yka (UPF0111/DUF47 family)